MKRLAALCLIGLATASCSLSLDENDQDNEQDPQPDDLPGDEYRLCVLQTLDECDFLDLTPEACTGLIGERCNGIVCPPDQMDPDGGGCPPTEDCYTRVFNECVAAGIDPQECAIHADMVCHPQCDPADPNCCMDPTGGGCEPPPPCDPMDPDGQCCDPATGQDCPPPPDDCWTIVFNDCVLNGGCFEDCAVLADQVCYPPPCDPATDPMCCRPGDPNCEPPPPCDPMTDPNCPCDPDGGGCEPPPHCDPMTDPNCPCDPDGGGCEPPPPCDPMNDPTCCRPGDPNCEPPPPCDPMQDPTCQPY